MAKVYERRIKPVEMLDGRRHAWKVGEDLYEVISRDAGERYRVEVKGGMPLCECTAAKFGRPCWHAALVLARLEREAPRQPEPSADAVFAMLAG